MNYQIESNLVDYMGLSMQIQNVLLNYWVHKIYLQGPQIDMIMEDYPQYMQGRTSGKFTHEIIWHGILPKYTGGEHGTGHPNRHEDNQD